MAIIAIGKGAEIHINYPVAVQEVHEKGPHRILVPSDSDCRRLFQYLYEAGSGNPGLDHVLKPDDYPAYLFIRSEFKKSIETELPLILYKLKSQLLLGIDTSNLVGEATSILASR